MITQRFTYTQTPCIMEREKSKELVKLQDELRRARHRLMTAQSRVDLLHSRIEQLTSDIDTAQDQLRREREVQS